MIDLKEKTWFKIVTFMFSIMLSGVVGYFTGLRAIDKEVKEVEKKNIELTTIIKNELKPKILLLDNLENELISVKQSLDLLWKQRYCQHDCVKFDSARFCNTGKLLVLFPNRKFFQCTSIFKEINARRV